MVLPNISTANNIIKMFKIVKQAFPKSVTITVKVNTKKINIFNTIIFVGIYYKEQGLCE